MSWDIFVYGEYRKSNNDSWKPISVEALHDSFKYRILGDISEYDVVDKTTIHSDLHHALMLDTNLSVTVRSISLGELRSKVDACISKYGHTVSLVYKALGLDVGDYGDDDIDEMYCCIDDVPDESETKDFPFQSLTYPVSKDLMASFLQDMKDYRKAVYMQGFCDTVSNMTDDYRDEIRLLFLVT